MKYPSLFSSLCFIASLMVVFQGCLNTSVAPKGQRPVPRLEVPPGATNALPPDTYVIPPINTNLVYLTVVSHPTNVTITIKYLHFGQQRWLEAAQFVNGVWSPLFLITGTGSDISTNVPKIPGAAFSFYRTITP